MKLVDVNEQIAKAQEMRLNNSNNIINFSIDADYSRSPSMMRFITLSQNENR